MRKLVRGFLIFVVLFTIPSFVHAENIAGNSAVLAKVESSQLSSFFQKEAIFRRKKNAIQAILEKNNSPMKDDVDAFIKTCREYELDCYLLPSIAALESGYGKQILQGTYNPFGWGGGRIYFTSWENGIQTVGYGLRYNYINKGAESIEQIGAKYAASKTWAIRVRNFMAQFEAEEKKNSLYLTSDSVKL